MTGTPASAGPRSGTHTSSGRGRHRHPGPAPTSSLGSGLHGGREGRSVGMCRCLLFGDAVPEAVLLAGFYLCSPGCWFWFCALIRGSPQQLETKRAPRSATCRVCVDSEVPICPSQRQPRSARRSFCWFQMQPQSVCLPWAPQAAGGPSPVSHVERKGRGEA